MYIVGSYAVYLAISLLVTVWVARTLHKNGRVFLVEAFHGNEELADSVNHLLVVGFYLVNLGYVALALRTGAALLTPREAQVLQLLHAGQPVRTIADSFAVAEATVRSQVKSLLRKLAVNSQLSAVAALRLLDE